MNIKTPAHQRDIYDWIAAHLPGAPAHYKYKYCQNGPETLASIAKSMSGRIIMASQVVISGGLTWREIARFNYGTDDPGEINYYLKWFNGCQRADPSGRNYRLDAGDKMPFVYLPAVALAAASTVNVIPAQPVAVQTPPPATELTQTALRRFDDLDGSKSGHIQRSDIRKALADKTFAGVEGAMLSTLYQHFGAIESLHMDEWLQPKGITRADLAEIDRASASYATPEVRAMVDTYLAAKAAIGAAGTALYAGALDPRATQQGGVGDCWFLAALVALDARAEAIVRAAIQQTPSGYQVTFAGGSSPVSVPEPTAAYVSLFSSTQGNGLWLTVLELALGTSFDSADPPAALNSIWENLIKAGPTEGIRLLTGRSVDLDWLTFTTMNSTRGKLVGAVAGGKSIVACIRGSFALWEDAPTRNGWPMAHAYSILGYSKDTDQIVVRNPWGAERNGRSIALSEFCSTWTNISYEE